MGYGLALSGGGVRGAAHVGVLRALLHIIRSVSIFIRHRRSSFLTNLTLYYTFLPPIMQDFKCEVCLKIVPAQPRISARTQFSNTLWRMPLICGKMSTYQKSKRCALL